MAGQREKKLKRLMEKAEELFTKYGYCGVSVDQIAKEACISKMTLYKYYQSKEDLFIEIMKRIIDYYGKEMMKFADEKLHTIEKIEAIQAYALQMAGKSPPVLTRDILEHPAIMEEISSYKLKLVKEMFRNILEDGMKKDEIRPLDIDFICDLLMGIPYAFGKTDYFTSEAKIAELMDKLFDFLKYGMLGGVMSVKEGEVVHAE